MYFMENPEMDDWGYPHFRKPPDRFRRFSRFFWKKHLVSKSSIFVTTVGDLSWKTMSREMDTTSNPSIFEVSEEFLKNF